MATAPLSGCAMLRHAVPEPPADVSDARAPATEPTFRMGVYEHSDTTSYRSIETFSHSIGRRPDIVLYYSGWLEPFRLTFAREISSHGAEPLVQIEPTGISLRAIDNGRYDQYLRSFADEIREYRHPVIVGFAHEMNGSWYTWGTKKTQPSTWVAAWRHVVSVFRSAGVANVTWLWTISRHVGSHGGQLRRYWPGSAYVNWVGIDGYYGRPSDRFSNVFTPAIVAVRSITDDPIILSEAAVGKATRRQALDITNLFAGIRRSHLDGLVWFDVDQERDRDHQDWRIEGSRAAIEAFKHGLRSL